MTPADVRTRVAEIASCSGDAECAHSLEDALYREVLTAIRDGRCAEPVMCCEIALKTCDIKFTRYCA